jgi:pimeloyl-ACP methyl ester carboxylesterase
MQSYTLPTLTDAETDTRVLIVESPDNGNEDVWIAFAGTASRKNVRTDLSVADAALFPGDKMRVHSGFLNAWMSVRDRVLAAASSASGRVYVVGHSMGGALATLAAMEISGVSGGPVRASVACVTFGAPAVGDELFADAFNSRVGQSVRVVNALDPIPRSLSSQFAQTRGLLLVSSTSLNVHSMDAYAVSVDATRAVRLLSMLAPVLVVSLAMTMMSRK